MVVETIRAIEPNDMEHCILPITHHWLHPGEAKSNEGDVFGDMRRDWPTNRSPCDGLETHGMASSLKDFVPCHCAQAAHLVHEGSFIVSITPRYAVVGIDIPQTKGRLLAVVVNSGLSRTA